MNSPYVQTSLWPSCVPNPKYYHESFSISDIEMPTIDGLNLTQRIESGPSRKGLPVVLFSSLDTKRLRPAPHRPDNVPCSTVFIHYALQH